MAGKLTLARQVLGLSQKELGQILKIDPSTFSKWELGNRMPQGSYLQLVRLFLEPV